MVSSFPFGLSADVFYHTSPGKGKGGREAGGSQRETAGRPVAFGVKAGEGNAEKTEEAEMPEKAEMPESR